VSSGKSKESMGASVPLKFNPFRGEKDGSEKGKLDRNSTVEPHQVWEGDHSQGGGQRIKEGNNDPVSGVNYPLGKKRGEREGDIKNGRRFFIGGSTSGRKVKHESPDPESPLIKTQEERKGGEDPS